MPKEPKDIGYRQGPRPRILHRQEDRSVVETRHYQPYQPPSQYGASASSTSVIANRSRRDVELAHPGSRQHGTIFSGASGVNVAGGHFVAAEVVNQYIQIAPPNIRQEERMDARPSIQSSVPMGQNVDMFSPFLQALPGTSQPQDISNTGNYALPPHSGYRIKRNQDIYYDHMSAQRRGSPLWIPEPSRGLPLEYLKSGVTIGDVGLITDSGSFDFLFNSYLSRDHVINPRDLPENFTAFSSPSNDVHRYSEFEPGSHICSQFINASRHTDSEDGSTDFTFEASPSASEGAILTMPVGLNSEDILGLDGLRRFIATNVEHWYFYANKVRHRSARNGDLRLVIGHDKTAAWGLATFQGSSFSSATGERKPCFFKFRSKEAGPQGHHTGAELGGKYYWEYSAPSAYVRTGPSSSPLVDPLTGLRRNNPSEEEAIYENQTLFIRTMNITLQDWVWRNMMDRLQPRPRKRLELPMQSPYMFYRYSPSLSSPSVNNLLKSSRPPASSSDSISDSASANSLYLDRHPSSAINQMLLQSRPNARLAITDDNDWISLLTEDDTVLPSAEELVRRLNKYFIICEEEGIVFLEKLHKIATVTK